MKSKGKALRGGGAARIREKSSGRGLLGPVRLIGNGKWDRNADGKWTLREFAIEGFEPLSDEPLSEALSRIRAINSFKDTTLDELEDLRRGLAEKQNGGH